MPVVNRAGTDTVEFFETQAITAAPNLPFYGTLAKANAYFRYRLDCDAWTEALNDRKIAALVQSTIAIDRLGFIGSKIESNSLEFPRDFQELVPVEIERACYENALKLLDGVEPDTEIDNLMTNSRAYGGVRTTLDRTSLAPHYLHGIASPAAWRFLQPYLNDGDLLVMKRGS